MRGYTLRSDEKLLMAATKGQWEPQFLETTKEFKEGMRTGMRAELREELIEHRLARPKENESPEKT